MVVVNGSDQGITVKGHANYASVGQDIVCAAVSTLIQGLILSINTLTSDRITINDISPGSVDIQYGNLSRDAQLLIDSFFVGAEMVADSYPDYVRVTKH